MSDNKAETGLMRSVKNYNLILMTSVDTLLKEGVGLKFSKTSEALGC